MLETTIENVLTTDNITKKIFRGAIARDELHENIEYPSCYVINTKPRSHRGEHWLAIFFDKDKNGFFLTHMGNIHININ